MRQTAVWIGRFVRCSCRKRKAALTCNKISTKVCLQTKLIVLLLIDRANCFLKMST